MNTNDVNKSPPLKKQNSNNSPIKPVPIKSPVTAKTKSPSPPNDYVIIEEELENKAKQSSPSSSIPNPSYFPTRGVTVPEKNSFKSRRTIDTRFTQGVQEDETDEENVLYEDEDATRIAVTEEDEEKDRLLDQISSFEDKQEGAFAWIANNWNQAMNKVGLFMFWTNNKLKTIKAIAP